ncbi:MAG: MerR family transcriptional regulator [Acidimicrobiia bacterium]
MTEGLRVEDLAAETGVSVDTIRFYQKRRLLSPPARDGRVAFYGADHVARLARIRELQGRGFSLAVIRRLLEGELDPADEPLVAAVAGAQRGEPVGDEIVERLTLGELAARAEVPEAILEAVARAGLLAPQVRAGVELFPATDVELVTAGLRLLEAGFPLPDLLALARRHHDMTRGIAEDAVRMFDDHVREPLRVSDLSDDEKAQRLVDAFRTLLPTVTSLVAQHFRSVLLEVATEHLESIGGPAELAAARAEPDWGTAAK